MLFPGLVYKDWTTESPAYQIWHQDGVVQKNTEQHPITWRLSIISAKQTSRTKIDERFDTLMSTQNGRHFAADIFKFIIFYGNFYVLI